MAVLIFKALEKCNSQCLYCGVVKKNQGRVMDYELLELVFQRMNDYLEEFPNESISFTWHGGEACLLGVDYFRKALEFQKRHCADTEKRIIHLIQSNMTMITQELIDVFKEMGINRIGSSFDPIPGIRGIGKERDSRLYNELFLKGAELTEKNGLSWGVIYVVHKKSLEDPLGIFRYLSNMNPRSLPMFNKIYLYKGDPYGLGITPEEFADFLGALFPLYWENRKVYPNLKPISAFVECIEGKGSMVCDFSGECTHNWMYVGPEGSASHCGKGGDYGFIEYGNIRDLSMKEILFHKKRAPMALRQQTLPEGECSGCRFWGICHGGCPLDAYATRGDFSKPSPECAWIKRFVEKYVEPVTGYRVNVPPENKNIRQKHYKGDIIINIEEEKL
jgi:uncharacterized protein